MDIYFFYFDSLPSATIFLLYIEEYYQVGAQFFICRKKRTVIATVKGTEITP